MAVRLDYFLLERCTRTTNGCLLAPGKSPYPKIKDDNGRSLPVSRAVLMRKLGRSLGADEECRHSCDEPRCVAEEHLSVGSHADNMRDMSLRSRRGRLTRGAVLAIRHRAAGGEKQCSLAAEFGVSDATISHIVHRETHRYF